MIDDDDSNGDVYNHNGDGKNGNDEHKDDVKSVDGEKKELL